MILRIILYQVIIILVSSHNIPSYVKLCSRNDPKLGECVRNSVTDLAPYLVKGIPEMDLPPMDPLDVPTISVNTGGSQIKLQAELTDCKLLNGGVYHIDYVTAYLENITFSANYIFPNLKAKGNYKFKGTILMYEIESKGIFDFDSKNVSVDMEWYGSIFDRSGKKHIKMNEIKAKTDIKEIKIYFHNLFENEDMTKTVNQVINDNIQELKKDLDNEIGKTISNVVLNYFNRVYYLFPIDELFPEA